MSKHDTKTAIRERMAATGENYTTARRAILGRNSDHPQHPEFRHMRYATSTHPDVINALRDRLLLTRHIENQRAEFVRRYAGEARLYERRSLSSPLADVTAIACDRKPTTPTAAAWKRGPKNRGWAPGKRHPELALWERIASPDLPGIPGAPDVILRESWFRKTTTFLHDGAAWLRLGFNLENGDDAPDASNAVDARYWSPTDERTYKTAFDAAKQVVVRFDDITEQETAQAWAILDAHDQARAARVEAVRQSARTAQDRKRLEADTPVRSQYVSTPDPEVIAAVTDAWDRWEAAHREATVWAHTFTGQPEYVSQFRAPALAVAGVATKSGHQWTRDRDSGVYRPAKRSAAYTAMDRIGRNSSMAPTIPGVQHPNWGVDREPLTTTSAFVHDGRAWCSLSGEPAEGIGFGPQWEPATLAEFTDAYQGWDVTHQERVDQIAAEAVAESDKGHEARRARREARERERARVEEDIDRTRAEGFAAQHVRTTDPQIVALVEKAWQDKVAARDRAFQWTRGHGLEGASLFGQDMGLHFSVMGLSEKPEGLGEWVRARGGGWKPAASNPLREELAVLGYEPPHFPGVERAYRASGDEPASGWFLFPTPFVADGAAWVSLGQFPDKGGKFGPQWEEVTGSQAAAAETKFRAAGD